MAEIILISGSPSPHSRSAAILREIRLRLTSLGFDAALLSVRDLPSADLLGARYDSPALQPAIDLVVRSRAVVVGTPIYKAAYSGALKTFLDVLPPDALRGKVVLPIATGGSPAHLLAIEYSLKPVLSVLGASELLQGVYAVDDQVKLSGQGDSTFDEKLAARLTEAIELFADRVRRTIRAPAEEIS